jgi:hypothetical protein
MATIIRIPFIKQLSQGDFLYSTTDVAIWSTVEPGIGITAAAMATLRPLFRTFFSRSKLLGSSTHNQSGSKAWPSSRKPGRAGYFRSGGGPNDRLEELGLRSDIAKGVGITTVIRSTKGPGHEEEEMGRAGKVKRSGSKNVLKKNVSETHLRDDSSEEFLPVQNLPTGNWNGVMKTMDVRTSEEVHRTKSTAPGPPS